MQTQMRALVKSKKAKGLELMRVPVPEIGPADVLIKVQKAAICGTDLHIYNWDEWAQKTIPVPMVVGHEFMGTVVKIGPMVNEVKVGDRVSGEGHLTCGHCRNCRAGKRHLCRATIGLGCSRSGCFAEYLSLPASNVFALDASIPDDIGAIFDPFGNAVHTALSFDLVGEDVLITGGGPIGYMAAAIARHVGARHVVVSEVNEYRLNMLKQLPRITAINPLQRTMSEVMSELGMKEGFDVGLEISGAGAAFASMVSAMNHGGKIALLGILPPSLSFDWTQVIFKGLFLKGIYGREMYETWYKMSTLLQGGLQINGVITMHCPMEEFEAGFQAAAAGNAGKVLLEW